jgi:hypothetical protein
MLTSSQVLHPPIKQLLRCFLACHKEKILIFFAICIAKKDILSIRREKAPISTWYYMDWFLQIVIIWLLTKIIGNEYAK